MEIHIERCKNCGKEFQTNKNAKKYKASKSLDRKIEELNEYNRKNHTSLSYGQYKAMIFIENLKLSHNSHAK